MWRTLWDANFQVGANSQYCLKQQHRLSTKCTISINLGNLFFLMIVNA